MERKSLVTKGTTYALLNKIDQFLRKIKRCLQARVTNKKRDKTYQMQTRLEFQAVKSELASINKLFITHDNDGGTKAYEKNYLKANTDLVVLRRLRYEFMEDKYFQLEFYREGNLQIERTWLLKSDELKIVFEYDYAEIILNSLVTFRCYADVLFHLIEYKNTHSNCILKYFVHDFQAVCPNLNLFINGRYCNLDCEKEKCDLFVGKRTIDIHEWRKNWTELFEVTDEIRCFSNSSKEIVEKVYPEIEQKKYKVIPHDVSYCKKNSISNIEELPLCIGIVGKVITEPKGKQVVSQILKCFGREIPIRVIGTRAWRYFIFRKKIKYLGPYKREELRDILIREKVSLVVFPSLCPETFSYLISELIALDIPIICFNCGAQAEKVAKYEKGIICKEQEEMLAVIKSIKNSRV